MRFERLAVPISGRGTTARRAVGEAARRLDAGELLVHPTSTLYGIGGAPRPAVDREVARVKGRDSGRPLLQLAPGASAVRERPGVRWDDRADRLAAAFWPGPLTLVLEDGSPTGLAVRVDSHPVVLELLGRAHSWLTSTSLNRTGQPPAVGVSEVRACLARLPTPERRVTWLDAGPLPASDPSTLVSLRERPARVLREGAVCAERIRAALGESGPADRGPGPSRGG